MNSYQKLITAAVIAVCTFTDLRSRKVPRFILQIYLLLSLAGRLAVCKTPADAAGLPVDLLPGVICILISRITRQEFGYGDSFLILGCGMSLGWKNCTVLVITAFFLSGIFAMFLFVKNRSGKQSFPFIPFLMVSFLFQISRI